MIRRAGIEAIVLKIDWGIVDAERNGKTAEVLGDGEDKEEKAFESVQG